MISNVTIDEFIALRESAPIIDVRSPKEFEAGAIPGAVNIPILDNEERARVGIHYKKVGREPAIAMALDIVEPKIAGFLEEVKSMKNTENILVHCWRGGMRSARFAEYLSQDGYNVSVLVDGYKAYRNKVYDCFKKKWKLLILGGMTGSGKTDIIKQLSKSGNQVIDLEGLACHKGSSFGAMGQDTQPSTEQFQNNLWEMWKDYDISKPVILEDESQAIGSVRIPDELFVQMRTNPVVAVLMDVEQRAGRIAEDYTKFPDEDLKNGVMRIRKRLGGLNAQHAIKAIDSKEYIKFIRIVLKYYDKAYSFGLNKRAVAQVYQLPVESSDPLINAKAVELFLEENNMKLWNQ